MEQLTQILEQVKTNVLTEEQQAQIDAINVNLDTAIREAGASGGNIIAKIVALKKEATKQIKLIKSQN